jgi:hypothetical protein
VFGQGGKSHKVCEDDGNPSSFGGRGCRDGRLAGLNARREFVPAGAAESKARYDLGAASRARFRQSPPASAAEPKAGRVLEAAARAAHGADSVRGRLMKLEAV